MTSSARGGGGRGGGRIGGGGPFGIPNTDFEPVPKERRARTLRRIVAFFEPYRLQVVIVLGAILATSLIGLINPLLLGLLLDNVIIGGEYDKLNLYVGLMIVLPIITGLIGVGQSYLNNVIGQNVMQDLRGALYSHLQSLPLRFFTETRTGEIQSRLANDVGGVQTVVTDTASSITSNLAVAISTIVAMFILSWQLSILSLGLTPFFLYLTYRVGKVRREVSTETQKSLAELTATTEETLSVSGILLSKTFGQQENSIAKFRAINKNLAALQIRQAMVGRWFFMIIGTIFSILPAFVYWLAGTHGRGRQPRRPHRGRDRRLHDPPEPAVLPAGPAAERPGGDPGVARPVRPDLRVPRHGSRDRRCARRRRDAPRDHARQGPVPRRQLPVPDRSGPFHPGPRAGRPGDTFERDDTVADILQEAMLPEEALLAEAQAAEPIRTSPRFPRSSSSRPSAWTTWTSRRSPANSSRSSGRPGSGKTTTTYLIPRLYDVVSGAVEIDDVDVRRIKLASLGEIIGVVTQETYLFHASIRDNLLYARPGCDAGGARGRRHRRRDARADHGAARGIRHDRRRAWLQVVGWREAADRHRPGAAQGPADPHPRRGDVGARHGVRAAHPGRLRAPDGRPHDDRHRPPPLDDPARRPDPRLRAWPDRRARHARRALAKDGLYARLYEEQFVSEMRPPDAPDARGRACRPDAHPQIRRPATTQGGMLFAASPSSGHPLSIR